MCLLLCKGFLVYLTRLTLLQKQNKIIDEQVVELINAKQGLDDLSNEKLDTEILSPISPGIFIKTNLKNNSEVIVNVGANVAVKKSISSSKDLLDKQINEMKEAQTKMLFQLTQITNQAMALETDINQNIDNK